MTPLRSTSSSAPPYPRAPLLITGAALLALAALVALPMGAGAQDAAQDITFVLNTFSFLVWGALVMWMCAGFTMLESGSVRSKNASVICLKNIGLYAIAGIAYYVVGYGLMYTDVGSFIGSLDWFYGPSGPEVRLMEGDQGALQEVVANGYSVTSDWFFQMVFVATTASIVSGSLAERVNIWAFFAFTLVLTGILYPVVGAWHWGGGWLADRGFVDFAGSTIVHSTGGWAALAGILVVGPRWGKFRKDGSVKSTPPSNIPAVTLGVFILWLGWFGFNGGSVLALGSASDVVIMSTVLVNTNLAAAGGVVAAIFMSKPILGRIDLFAGLNGAIAGLVSITAAPDIVDGWVAILIGAVGAILCTSALKVMERYRIDDVVGAVPAHLVAGIWGTLAACIEGGGQFWVQLQGIAAVGVFVFSISFVLWKSLDLLMGVRVSRQVEEIGQDAAELGLDAYPEFVLMVDPDDGMDFRDPN